MSEAMVPIFQVAFRNGMWWSIPADMSQQLYQKYMNNEDAVYTWDWGKNVQAPGNQMEKKHPSIVISLISRHGSSET